MEYNPAKQNGSISYHPGSYHPGSYHLGQPKDKSIVKAALQQFRVRYNRRIRRWLRRNGYCLALLGLLAFAWLALHFAPGSHLLPSLKRSQQGPGGEFAGSEAEGDQLLPGDEVDSEDSRRRLLA